MSPNLPNPDDLDNVIDRAIIRAFLQIGIASSDGKEIIELQKDFSYLRDLRLGAQAIKSKGLLAVVGIIITVISTLIFFGVQFFIQHGGSAPPGHG